MLFASCILLLGGYTAQAIGLEYTTAARGAFTGTFTVLAVPLLVGFSGRKVPATTWVAAVVALIGIADYELLVPLMPEAAGHAEPVQFIKHTPLYSILSRGMIGRHSAAGWTLLATTKNMQRCLRQLGVHILLKLAYNGPKPGQVSASAAGIK